MILWTLVVISLCVASAQQTRRLEVVNQSGKNVAIDWIDPKTGRPVTVGQTYHGQQVVVDSFVNHTLWLHDPSFPEGQSVSSPLAAPTTGSLVTVNEEPSQRIVIHRDLSVSSELVEEENAASSDSMTQSSALVASCRAEADAALKETQRSFASIRDDLEECLLQSAADLFIQKNEEVAFEADLRTRISKLAENYTCADPLRQTSPPVRVGTWRHDDVEHRVHVLHVRSGSKIHMLHNFITPEECNAIKQEAEPKLRRGTVADGKGGSRLSENRKAWQAGVEIPVEDPENPILRVVERLYAYTNHATGYNISLNGQENLMSIQYFGNGLDDQTPDQYTPHCDGTCDGTEHKKGGRVATMVMYCDVPERGGGTNFQNSNVFVKPVTGAAAFFSYLDPRTMRHETGFTSHSGCPVLLGTKRIAVHWMRIGVDDENPWDSFDTNTVKIGAEEDDDNEE